MVAWFSALILHTQLSPVSPIFQHFVIWHTRAHSYSFGQLGGCCFFFYQPLFLSLFFPHLEHMHHVSVALCLPFRTAALAGYPWDLLYAHIHAPRTHAYTHQQGHKSPPPSPSHIHTHTHVPMSSLLLFHRLRPVVPELTLLYYSFCFHIFPLDYYFSPLQFSVTTAVCQLSACPSLVKDEAETQRVYREASPASLSLPAVTPASDFHLSRGSFLPLATLLEIKSKICRVRTMKCVCFSKRCT